MSGWSGPSGCLADRQRPAEQRLRLPVPALGPEQPRQVVEAVGRVGVVGAQRRLADRQRPADQRLRLPVPALGPEQPGQIVEAVGRVGVVGAQRRLADRQRPAEQRLRLPVPAPGPEPSARLLRLMAVSGWSGPSAASRIASARRCSSSASPYRPWARIITPRSLRLRAVWGWSGPTRLADRQQLHEKRLRLGISGTTVQVPSGIIQQPCRLRDLQALALDPIPGGQGVGQQTFVDALPGREAHVRKCPVQGPNGPFGEVPARRVGPAPRGARPGPGGGLSRSGPRGRGLRGSGGPAG